MKISKIYISAFGGLKDFSIELDGNMNVVFGENENGKTTLMAFILASFYGTKTKQKSVSANMRIKYAPFDGSPMGGRIYFENANKNFCLERQFLKSDSTDKVTLTNMDTGERVSVPSDIGTTLFGMGADAFKSSMFIGAEKSGEVGEEAVGELNARLSSVALTGDENTSFEKISSRIEKAKEKVLSKSGRAGLLFRAKEQLKDLNDRYENAKSDLARKSEISKEKEDLIKKGQELSTEYLKYKKITDSKEDIKNAEKLKEYLDLKDELDKLNESLTMSNGKIADSSFVSSLKFCLSKIESQQEKCDDIKKDIAELEKANELDGNMSGEEAKAKLETLKKDIFDLDTEKTKLESEKEKFAQKLEEAENNLKESENAKKPFNPLFVFLGIVCAVAGVTAGIITNPLFYISALFGVLLLVLAFVFKPNNEGALLEAKEKIAEIKQSIAEIKDKSANISEKITAYTGNMNMLVSVINADETVRAKRKEELSAKKERLSEENEKLNGLKDELEKVSGGISLEELDLTEMENNAETQKNLKLRLNYLCKDLGNISYEEAREKLAKNENAEKTENIDFVEAEREKERIGEEMNKTRDKVTSLDTELKTSFRNFEQPEVLEREISLLLEKIRNYSDFVDSCNMAREVLEESFSDIRKGYGTALEEKTLNNFSRLTNGKYGNIGISKSLDITVEDKNIFGMREVEYLSTGTIDQAVLSLRLAICELIGKNGKTPVMLDDALSNYDDKRTLEALKFLKEFSSDNQVLLFTCHKSIVDMAKEIGITTKNLRG